MKPQPNPLKGKLKTAVTFTADDLTALVRYVRAGQLLLQTNHHVISKINKALGRLGLAKPPGFRGLRNRE